MKSRIYDIVEIMGHLRAKLKVFKSKYEWYDIVEINGKHFAEHFEISGEMDGPDHVMIDEFLEAVAKKHGVDVDDVLTYMMDDIDFDPHSLPYGAECCGLYVNGILT